MKKFIVVALTVAMVMMFGVGSASAANSLRSGSKGFSVGFGDSVFGVRALPGTGAFLNNVVMLSGRYFTERDMALLGGIGLQSDGGDADATFFGVSGGVRKYLKVDDFAPFFEGRLTIITVDDDAAGIDQTIIDLGASLGAEYFFAKQFSIEGAIGIGLGQIDFGAGDDTYFGTRTVGVFANFYF